MGELGVCLLCGAEFVKTRPDKKYCTRRCTMIANDRATRARAKARIEAVGTDCPYNVAIDCYEHKCNSCGWNPRVAKERTEKILQKMEDLK